MHMVRDRHMKVFKERWMHILPFKNLWEDGEDVAGVDFVSSSAMKISVSNKNGTETALLQLFVAGFSFSKLL